MGSSLKSKTLKGVIWSIVGQLGNLFIVFFANIILARLLLPTEFGQMGILMFFIALGNVLTESGLGGALIRKKVVTNEDYSTIFIFNLGVSIVCFTALFLSSGMIADYYDDPALRSLLIVAGFTFLINAFRVTQNAALERDLNYKKVYIFRIASSLISACIAIVLAWKGYGAWALLSMYVLNAVLNTLMMVLSNGLYFSLKFNRRSFKELYAFGVNTTLAAILNTVFNNINQLVLARHFSITQTGFYYQAKKLEEVPVNTIKTLILGVFFSSLSKLQDSKEEFVRVYNKVVLLFTSITGLTTIFLFLYADELIVLLFGQNWADSGFYMKLLSVVSFFYLQEMLNRVIFKVFNKTHQILFLEIASKSIQAISVILGVYYKDIKILLIGYIISSVISYLINYYFSRRILGGVKLSEIFTVIKVVTTTVIIGILYYFTVRFTGMTGYFKFALAPIFLVLYVYILKWGNVVDLLREIKNLKKM